MVVNATGWPRQKKIWFIILGYITGNVEKCFQVIKHFIHFVHARGQALLLLESGCITFLCYGRMMYHVS